MRRVLDRRPDQALVGLDEPSEPGKVAQRAESALAAVRSFMSEVQVARAEVTREERSEPGSVAKRLGLDASERAKPFLATLAQLEETYGRVGHRLEALLLRARAEADTGKAAQAALAVAGEKSRTPPPDVVQVSLEVGKAQQAAAGALSSLGAAPSQVTEVVVRASASLARDAGDEDALAEVLRSVQRELG